MPGNWLASIADPFPQTKLVGRSHSWLGFAQLLTGEDRGPLVLGLTAALILATGAVLVRLLRGRLAFESPRFGVQFSAMVLATPLVSPYLYKTYDLAIFVLPLVVLAREMPASMAARRLWLGRWRSCSQWAASRPRSPRGCRCNSARSRLSRSC